MLYNVLSQYLLNLIKFSHSRDRPLPKIPEPPSEDISTPSEDIPKMVAILNSWIKIYIIRPAIDAYYY